MDVTNRNVEVKARDRDPARSLRRALALGAADHGEIWQRDTYFGGARGRLKLREQEPGDPAQTGDPASAELIEYSRADSTDARTSTYRRVAVRDAAAIREALDAAYGTLVTVTKRRRLLLWENVRIHLDEVEGLGSYLEFEAVAGDDSGLVAGDDSGLVAGDDSGLVAGDDSDLAAEHEKVARLRAELGVEDADLVATSYSDLVMEQRKLAPVAGGSGETDSAEELLLAAEAVMRTAYVPYSRFPVGAALRAPDGSVHVGSNVENASYPQGQCAETSAIGALIAAGHTRIVEVAVTAERMDLCPPCGGCRQRLAEFADADTPVHLGRPGGPRETTTVGELLPLAFELDPPA